MISVDRFATIVSLHYLATNLTYYILHVPYSIVLWQQATASVIYILELPIVPRRAQIVKYLVII